MELVVSSDPVQSLNKAFMLNFPIEAARLISTMPASEAANNIVSLPTYVVVNTLEKLSHGVLDAIILALPDEKSIELLCAIDAGHTASLLSRLDEQRRLHYMSLLDKDIADEVSSLMEYPEDCAGKLMNTKIIAFNENITVQQAVKQMKHQRIVALHHLFILGDDMKLHGQVDIERIVLANPITRLSSLLSPVTLFVQALDPKDKVIHTLNKYSVDVLPVVDIDYKLVGVIEGHSLIEALRDDVATNMQTMVGVSKDERALSSSWVAVRKRLPWLQINLLTAFLAAAVVGIFEGTIAKYTALAILLPIAAGQSGNTGAQALAVTMRGLTLREITVRHWLRVTLKEMAAGFINGLAIAITCGAGVFIWSGSIGLSLIIALAMISSMTIAAVSGALVPIILKKLGQDPALSSSIILTTVTDIAGFMSFLGIATLLSGLLEAG